MAKQKRKLRREQKAVLRKASRESIQEAFEKIDLFFRRNKWIGSTNRYRSDCVERIRKDNKKERAPEHKHLRDYIAASTLLHCADAWCFLGRALESHSVGDSDVSRHLAYYAELRAVMALLATEGIGVFNNCHYVVNDSGDCQPVKGLPTHVFTWLAFEHWAGLKKSFKLLRRVITPGGVPLGDCLESFGAEPNFPRVGRKWLKDWGLDLKRLCFDRDARNESSYRPTRLTAVRSLDVSNCSFFLRDLFGMLKPSLRSRFDELDMPLLKNTLDTVFYWSTGNTPHTDPRGFRRKLAIMLGNIVNDETKHEEWTELLTREGVPQVMQEAYEDTGVRNQRHHIQVISRAALLLRIATGSCALMLRKANFGREDLEFWWGPLGEDRGLWSPGKEPESFLDLWNELNDAIGEIISWETSNEGNNASYFEWREEQARSFSMLGSCERVALWGLGL